MSSSASPATPTHGRGEEGVGEGTAGAAAASPPTTSRSPSLRASVPSVDFIDYLTQQKAALLQLLTSTQARSAPSATAHSAAAAAAPAPHHHSADAHARAHATAPHGATEKRDALHSEAPPRCATPPSSSTPTTADAGVHHHEEEDRNPLSGFLSYLALPGVYAEAQHMMEPMTPAAECSTITAEVAPDATQESRRSSTNMSAPSSHFSTTPTTATGTGAASAAAAAASSSSSAPPLQHAHQLRPTQFLLPALCEVCKAAMLDVKVWPPPLPRQRSAASPSSEGTGGGAAAAPFSLFSFLASPTTPTPPDAPPSTDAAPASPPSAPPTCSTAPSPAPQTSSSCASSSSAPAAPSQPVLAFGMEGYRCDTCGLALHRQCLAKMRATQPCEVMAPLAHAMPSHDADVASDAAASVTASPSNAGSSSSSSGSSGGGFSGPFSWDRVKAMVANYLDPNDGAYSRRDSNVKAVLGGVFALLDTVIARYPTLTPFTVVKRYPAMQELSTAHQTLYTACTASLRDTTLLRCITWRDLQRRRRERTGVLQAASQAPLSAASAVLRPLRVDTSVLATIKASMTGTSPSSGGGSIGNSIFSSSLFSKSVVTPMTGAAAAAGDASAEEEGDAQRGDTAEVEDRAGATRGLPRATSPVQLLLWQAMRYATAVYGEVYRRGSLSSAITATLLFTVNRSGVEVPKPVNDAAVTTLLDLPPSSLRLSRWAARAAEPSYALLVDDAAGRIVIAFRGTLNTFDIMTDLAAVGQAFCGGHAHQGAAEVVNTLFDQRASRYGDMLAARRRQRRTEAAAAAPQEKEGVAVDVVADADCGKEGAPQPRPVTPEPTAASSSNAEAPVLLTPYVLQPLSTPDGLLDGLEELAATYPTYSILITGHSLGGGVAVLFATRLHHDRALPESVLRRVHVIAFAPMPTLSLPAASCFDEVSCATTDGGYTTRPPSHATAAEATDPTTSAPACFPVWSVVNGFDCVPRLQVNTIDRLLRQVVGPQLAPASSSSSSASPAAAAAAASAGAVDERRRAVRERRLRSRSREGAVRQTSPTEMTEMSPRIRAGGGEDGQQSSETGNAPALEAHDALDHTGSTGSAPVDAAACEREQDVVVAVGMQGPSAQTQSQKSATSTALNADGETASLPPPRSPSAPHDLSQELHHPGRVLLLTSPWDMSANRLVDVPRGHPVMHELFLMKSMLQQHMVDAYSGALGQINEEDAPRDA